MKRTTTKKKTEPKPNTKPTNFYSMPYTGKTNKTPQFLKRQMKSSSLTKQEFKLYSSRTFDDSIYFEGICRLKLR